MTSRVITVMQPCNFQVTSISSVDCQYLSIAVPTQLAHDLTERLSHWLPTQLAHDLTEAIITLAEVEWFQVTVMPNLHGSA